MTENTIVILISGEGNTMLAIAKNIKSNCISLVVADRLANGIRKATEIGLSTDIIKYEKDSFENNLIARLDQVKPSLIVCAGFMRILSARFINHFNGRIMNIHPSLLPKYKGLNTYARAIANKDKEHGTTVHWVTAEIDAGPIIAQSKIPILDNDTEDTLKQRVKNEEYILYPKVINQWLNSKKSP